MCACYNGNSAWWSLPNSKALHWTNVHAFNQTKGLTTPFSKSHGEVWTFAVNPVQLDRFFPPSCQKCASQMIFQVHVQLMFNSTTLSSHLLKTLEKLYLLSEFPLLLVWRMFTKWCYTYSYLEKKARKPRRNHDPPSDRLTGAKLRATSVAKNWLFCGQRGIAAYWS